MKGCSYMYMSFVHARFLKVLFDYFNEIKVGTQLETLLQNCYCILFCEEAGLTCAYDSRKSLKHYGQS